MLPNVDDIAYLHWVIYMQNIQLWQPSKFVWKGDRLIASRDPLQVSISSRLIGDCIASFYEKAIPTHTSGHLVDLGCGKVPLYHVYKNYCTEITCIDWANTLHPNPHLDISQDLNLPIQLNNEIADTVILSDVLEHIEQPQLLLNEISRILKPNGKLLMNVPFLYWLHETPHDYHRYTNFALEKMLQKAGLKIELLEPYGGTPEVLTDMTAKLLVQKGRIGKMLANAIQQITSKFITTSFGKKISKKSAQNFPAGYVIIAQK